MASGGTLICYSAAVVVGGNWRDLRPHPPYR